MTGWCHLRRHRRSLRDESGQALVEFALVVPIFLLLLLGIVEFARAWNVHEVLTDAAREGARRAVVDNPNVTLDSVVAAIQRAGTAAGIEIQTDDVTVIGFRSGRGENTTVRIDYAHELQWIGVLLDLLTGERTINMATEFTMRNE